MGYGIGPGGGFEIAGKLTQVFINRDGPIE